MHDASVTYESLRESTFSMMKRKFGDAVRSKEDTAMVNEVLCKVLAHNIFVLNQEECEFGIEAMFSKIGTEAAELVRDARGSLPSRRANRVARIPPKDSEHSPFSDAPHAGFTI